MASESDVLAGTSDRDLQAFCMGLQPTKFQMYLSNVPNSSQLGKMARQMGFTQVASGPFVRSSYHARDMAEIGIE